MFSLRIFKRKPKQIEEIKPMKVIQVGNKLPFNEMGAKQNITIHHLI